ncbi:hypothetical protein VTL71DRAFT_11126 [Oculimacula yallundae]|uniref:Uncharacterized protein n=1 Tax=Oculimacula yallundae TaxID=86028 RepID=A0ABR4CV94_9HELO
MRSFVLYVQEKGKCYARSAFIIHASKTGRYKSEVPQRCNCTKCRPESKIMSATSSYLPSNPIRSCLAIFLTDSLTD